MVSSPILDYLLRMSNISRGELTDIVGTGGEVVGLVQSCHSTAVWMAGRGHELLDRELAQGCLVDVLADVHGHQHTIKHS